MDFANRVRLHDRINLSEGFQSWFVCILIDKSSVGYYSKQVRVSRWLGTTVITLKL